jgi:hypothetical protein
MVQYHWSMIVMVDGYQIQGCTYGRTKNIFNPIDAYESAVTICVSSE